MAKWGRKSPTARHPAILRLPSPATLRAKGDSHGPSGRGNPGPAYPSVGGQHGAYTTARLNYYRAGSDKALAAAPAMVDIAKRLSDEDIQGLATYIEGLHHADAAKKAE